jgi:hypothetical protein
MSFSRYDYLKRKTLIVHDEQRHELSKEALAELDRFHRFEFYTAEKMRQISRADGVQKEIDKLVSSILAEREACPEGSNQECAAMDMLTEFVSKLDLEDFRKLRIEKLCDNPTSKE